MPKIDIRILIKYLTFTDYSQENLFMVLMFQKIRLEWQLKIDMEHYLLISMEKLEVNLVEVGALEVKFVCYSDMVDDILKELVPRIKQGKKVESQSELNWLIELAKASRNSQQSKFIYNQALRYLKHLLSDSPAYSKLNFQDIKDFAQVEEIQERYFSSERWDILFYGNMESKKALEVWERFFKNNIPRITDKP